MVNLQNGVVRSYRCFLSILVSLFVRKQRAAVFINLMNTKNQLKQVYVYFLLVLYNGKVAIPIDALYTDIIRHIAKFKGQSERILFCSKEFKAAVITMILMHLSLSITSLFSLFEKTIIILCLMPITCFYH